MTGGGRMVEEEGEGEKVEEEGEETEKMEEGEGEMIEKEIKIKKRKSRRGNV